MNVSPGIVDACPNVLQGASAQLFITLINTLMTSQCSLGPDGRYPPNYGPQLKDGDEFDFIVVGAGSAGSIVANRLSENAEWKVLLLEAGGYPSGVSEIPALFFTLQDSEHDWQYKMEPSKTCCLGTRCRCPRGKGLGGSSSINAMQYTRSTKYDHERWTNLGIDGWDYNSVLKYYKNFENVNITDNLHYGTKGDLHISSYTSTQPIRKILENAYKELGYDKYTEDTPHGFRDNLLTVRQGTRTSTAKAFLLPVRDRKNLYVAVGAHVGKLLIQDDNLAVKGVQVKINEHILSIKVRKEVILSAGTINSPQILMNSGIGPKKHLTELGISVVKDLMVGHNFQDHASFHALAVRLDPSTVPPESPQDVIDDLYKFFAHRQGSLTNIKISNFMAFINTKNNTNFANLAILPVLIGQKEPHVISEIKRTLQIHEAEAKTFLDYNQDHPMLLIIPGVLHPKSRGFVRLQNSDPYSKALIVHNFLGDENGEDIEVMLQGVKIIQKLVKTNPLALYHAKIIDTSIPNCKKFVSQSDDSWKCAFRHSSSSLFHPVGTCKMGPASDAMAVVDPQLRVHGVKGIRVIDGSIIPLATSSNTNAPIIMIGEKGAALIKEHWLKNQHKL